MIKKFFHNIPFDRVNWVTSSFLIGTLTLALITTPWYIYTYGLDTFQVCLFLGFYLATGLSITLGYHRLFSHLAFKAKTPVKLFVLLFGAGAFENAAIEWCSDHRRHHKHVDGEQDPYDITQGFWHAHIGWLLFKLNPEPPMDNVGDLRKDPLVMWQYKYILPLSVFFGFIFPTLIGYWYGGAQAALGGFLIGGLARVVFVQQTTFCINSLCHTVGAQPYSSKHSARDHWTAALITLGEGYHNYHHEFQHDYRNGVKPWQFDPTKWIIYGLSKIGLASNLRRVPESKILLAQLRETQRRLEEKAQSQSLPEEALKKLTQLSESFQSTISELQENVLKQELPKKAIKAHRKNIKAAMAMLNQLSPAGA